MTTFYRRKANPVHAVQWFVGVEVEGVTRCPKTHCIGETVPEHYVIQTPSGLDAMTPGDWVLTHADGTRTRMANDRFLREYEPHLDLAEELKKWKRDPLYVMPQTPQLSACFTPPQSLGEDLGEGEGVGAEPDSLIGIINQKRDADERDVQRPIPYNVMVVTGDPESPEALNSIIDRELARPLTALSLLSVDGTADATILADQDDNPLGTVIKATIVATAGESVKATLTYPDGRERVLDPCPIKQAPNWRIDGLPPIDWK